MLLVVTFISLMLAVAMSGVAWRVVREERRRSQARVEALAAAIRHEESGAEKRDGTRLYGDLFTAAVRRPARARLGLVVVLGAFAVAGVAAVAVALSALSGTTGAVPAATTVRMADAPLELVALEHERAGDTLSVQGVVRNSRDAAPVSQLVAVVFAFSRAGGFVASRRAAVATPTLAAGAESSFTVTLPGLGDVGRYRVSFRTEDRVMPHIDRRERGVALSLP